MVRLPFSYLPAYKRELRASLAGPDLPPLPSGHLSEALAWAAGYRTHAALTQAQPRSVSLDPARLWARLEELGHARPQGRPNLAPSSPGHTPGDDLMMLTPMGLGYSPEQAHALAWMARQPSGAVLVTGATCAGKSTTVRSLAFSSISRSSMPRSAQAPGPGARRVDETEPAPAISSVSSQDALLAAMRADPQRLVLGEVRDATTARALMETVQSGKAVWSTLHADSLSSVFYRLLGLGVTPRQMDSPDFLIGLVHQRLMPVVCGHCAPPLDLVALSSLAWGDFQHTIRALLAENLLHLRQRGTGCIHCRHTGYAHRTVVASMVTAQAEDLSPRHRFGKGWPHLSTHVLEKVRAGLLDLRDVRALTLRLDRPGPPVA